MRQNRLRRVIAATVLAVGIGARAWGTERPSTVSFPADASMSSFYTAPTANVGEFPGRLVRLSCDADDSGTTGDDGTRPRHGYGLMTDGAGEIHPLLPGTDEARQKLASIGTHRADVTVHGKYYPSTGAILVSRVLVRDLGANLGDEARQRHAHVRSSLAAQCASD